MSNGNQPIPASQPDSPLALSSWRSPSPLLLCSSPSPPLARRGWWRSRRSCRCRRQVVGKVEAGMRSGGGRGSRGSKEVTLASSSST